MDVQQENEVMTPLIEAFEKEMTELRIAQQKRWETSPIELTPYLSMISKNELWELIQKYKQEVLK